MILYSQVAIEVYFVIEIILSCELIKILDLVSNAYAGYVYETYKIICTCGRD